MILLKMPKESSHRKILDNLKAEKELAENLLLLIQLDAGTSDGSMSMAFDSDNDSLMFMRHKRERKTCNVLKR